jgi:hypothetical protein
MDGIGEGPSKAAADPTMRGVLMQGVGWRGMKKSGLGIKAEAVGRARDGVSALGR